MAESRFERKVLNILEQMLGPLGSEVAGGLVFHRIAMEGEEPNAEVVIDFSRAKESGRQTQRYPLSSPELSDESSPESVAVLIGTWVQGG